MKKKKLENIVGDSKKFLVVMIGNEYYALKNRRFANNPKYDIIYFPVDTYWGKTKVLDYKTKELLELWGLNDDEKLVQYWKKDVKHSNRPPIW